ncbi:helix-turn-helix domain-containing protein [Altererythrobacter salegens]|uniref:Helix-turn-helix domain-containing protein n=1 Tax=Croceibacterium salegens TaxID=1737568 RepID=A0A6I4SVS6_9SPHN|nr:helix-turn-helix transcriptional regulator [Croceibacterium salegens]MXO59449.1 helix-turn-helix domain-containing protein [Croceibacterium salegens]
MASAALSGSSPAWGRVPISSIEDLHDAVLGAGLEVAQFSSAPIAGSLAFARFDDITYSSGSIDGHVGLFGPLSESMVTIGVLLDAGLGARHWQNEVGDLAVGVFRAGDMHEAIYRAGALYGTATLSEERLEAVAADQDLVLDIGQLGGTGISETQMASQQADAIRHGLQAIHSNRALGIGPGIALAQGLLDGLIAHLAREPRLAIGISTARQHGLIVRRACAFIEENLVEPLTIQAIAKAAYTSHRTLYRAFLDVLDDSPLTYVRKLRLNRIRQELATDTEARCTISVIANRWGISELGRMSGWYRELFGELPSETLVRSRTVPRSPVGLARCA